MRIFLRSRQIITKNLTVGKHKTAVALKGKSEAVLLKEDDLYRLRNRLDHYLKEKKKVEDTELAK